VEGHEPREYTVAVRTVLARRELLAVGARRHAAPFSWGRTADALIDAYTPAAEGVAAAPLPLRRRLRGPAPPTP